MQVVDGIKRMIDRQLELGRKEAGQKRKEVESLFAERARVHLIIRGTVQGVFFRSFVEKTAQGLGLTGWVKNKDDGYVEVVAEGDRDKLEELVKACKKGSRWAAVTDVDVKWQKFLGEFSGFSVRM